MTSFGRSQSISRRGTLAGLGAGVAGLALAAAPRLVAAKGIDMASHPLVGTWIAGTGPNDLGLVHWHADGSMTNQASPVAPGPDGALAFSSAAMGVWEPVSERGIHITFTWATLDATGALTGWVSVDGYPVANDDGNSFRDNGTKVVVSVLDPSGATVQVIHTVPPVTGVRVTPGKPGYVEVLAMIAAAAPATPTP